ncbi:hypothetical protein [Ruixingdingia sedimenti]|uniref:Lipoprotein n=1 Tax=Ruixingdingia sedimenti TaxID=3073604 RepID=A0ABU1F5U6_9RHOB|nr:hypothetical protein [Xinfangfangia sp. LG-4]MDR5652241.1 hypothetical protein [Xinfangfangia sp. LG-4]
MRPAMFLPLTALLAACAGGAVARPQPIAAEVIRAVLVVHMSDGGRCVALNPVAEGAGRFGNCPDLSWRLTADPQVNPLRRVIEEGLGLLGARDVLQPMGLIEVADAAGRVTSFVSPPPDRGR